MSHSKMPRTTTATTFFISNLHCPSCVEGIKASFSALEPRPDDVIVSIISHSVIVHHETSLPVPDISESLDAAGFEVHSIFQEDQTIQDLEIEGLYSKEWHASLEHAVSKWLHPIKSDIPESDARMKELHLEHCEQCKNESGGVSLVKFDDKTMEARARDITTISSQTSLVEAKSTQRDPPLSQATVVIHCTSSPTTIRATFAISGMTCASCVSAITYAIQGHSWVHSTSVNLLTNSAVVVYNGQYGCEEIITTIEGCGFEVTVEKVENIANQPAISATSLEQQTKTWRATYALSGLTCSACVGAITAALEPRPWIDQVDVNLITNIATIIFKNRTNLPTIKEVIENVGYGAVLEDITAAQTAKLKSMDTSVAIRIEGMFCHHCPNDITTQLLRTYGENQTLKIEGKSLSLQSPILNITYVPNAPEFGIRSIFKTITLTSPLFKPSIYHPLSIEERARGIHAQERQRILIRLSLSIVIAIPTFILGIVFMSLVGQNHPIRRYLEQPTWSGNVTRIDWALFILATPVYCFATDTFHRRALRELKAMWRPGSRKPVLHRFIRFGSMNMLISLGTTVAYITSIVNLTLAATSITTDSMQDSYFDAVVFLTIFLLIGRFLEAYSKVKTGDAVTSLGKLRPEEATLVDAEGSDAKIPIDMLDIGDTVRVHYGTSPPHDGTILDGSSLFDESSLTGESRPVKKGIGDIVYSGTINKGPPVKVKITTTSGTSMLDQIINAVREGQTRRAPVERVADTITSHFVPFVIAIAIVTWITWLILGTTGTLPRDWKSEGSGGWPLWSLRFAIAVFVIACPCGIGLAAPTALFVGGGLAAKHGILVRGGGEAFQEASSLDCMVFDKTGTLTQGGDPTVTSHYIPQDQDSKIVFGLVTALEENSNHPIARALLSFCGKKDYVKPKTVDVNEIPGKGLKGTFKKNELEIMAIIGNESFMADFNVTIPSEVASQLESWKLRGESVALVSVQSRRLDSLNQEDLGLPSQTWALVGTFGIADPLRPEAKGVVSALQKRGIDVWMLSGDNPTTANAVGTQVGIPASNIIAGVLPDQKAKKIKYLQQVLTKRKSSSLFKKRADSGRAIVAMVGDGINDAPALSTADISIAIGSGSDIALSSSSFILIKSQLTTILTLLDLSSVVFRRVYFNFGWAIIYNLIAMPIAAGVLYPITTGTIHSRLYTHGMTIGDGMPIFIEYKKHIRLDPVWASLAMALSSVSVVCSSLALRSSIPGLGFRASEITPKDD